MAAHAGIFHYLDDAVAGVKEGVLVLEALGAEGAPELNWCSRALTNSECL